MAAARFALLITPAQSTDEERADFSDSFRRIDPGAPALSVGELSTQRGDGIFESIGVVDGHAQEVEAHVQRLAHSAALCELPEPHREQWRLRLRAGSLHELTEESSEARIGAV